ncbi:MAG TPA: hypothetical protein PK875_06985 [Spirochaetota bacterium]|nr:hypothetical protein [Spirochaetota bacterium]
MKNMASKFTEDDLREIGDYLAARYPVLKSGGAVYISGDIKIDLYERMVRVEEELKHQRELIQESLKMMDKRFAEVDKRFEQIDKRFEQVDKRFEQVDKRFEDLRSDMNSRFEQVDRRFTMLMWFIGIGFTLVTSIMTAAFAFLR